MKKSSPQLGRISSPNKNLNKSLDTLMTQIHQPPPDPRLHACVRSSGLCSSRLSTAFALLTADGSVYAWGHPETMAARKRWNTKKEKTLKSVGISYRSAVQKKFGGLIFVGYIHTLNLTDMLGLFCQEFFR